MSLPEFGSFVRGRTWLVEGVASGHDGLSPLRLACVADDAQGEPLDVLWDAEIGAFVHRDDAWEALAAKGTDDPEAFGAYVRTVGWNTATAADRDLFQAPFRAGIRLDAYQLLPLRKALRLPRVNMLIADDVGLGKTVEAGLVLRELLLRRRIDLVLVAAPPSMTLQWQDELEAKFGLSFVIIDRERLSELRRLHGFSVNPWATGSRFIISHRLLTEESYVAPLRDLLGDFRPRGLLILDEAHHAAPASGTRYAIDSQITRAVRDLSSRFEHRLFLSATPHNGHSNSFSALLEMLDPQRFTRGVDINPKDLEPIMVRRLKADLRRIGESFPERIVEAIPIEGLPPDAPELSLARSLADYARLREERIAALPPHEAAQARILLVGLQQRLLSSIAASARTLKAHRKTLARLSEGTQDTVGHVASAAALLSSQSATDPSELDLEDEAGADALIAEDDAAVAAATVAAERNTTAAQLKAELAAVDAMLAVAEAHATKPDARVRWLTKWINDNLVLNGRWNERRVTIFTEFEDTRRWLERRLREAIADTDQADERIGVFTGATSAMRREALIGQNRLDARLYAETLRRDTWETNVGIDLAFIQSLVAVHRLREVMCLYGFTRFEAAPTSSDGDIEDVRLTVDGAPLGLATDWLPAIEQFGEGLFIHVNPNAIGRWLARTPVQERVSVLLGGSAAWAQAKYGTHAPELPSAAYILLHTLSHALISEIALDCGYPASSLKERVYALSDPSNPGQVNRCSILIYTATAGSFGTLGGLVATAPRFAHILAAALGRLQICSNDPVCADHDPANRTDDRALHGAACHGCLLIAETSCEMRNVFLDRALIVETMANGGSSLFSP